MNNLKRLTILLKAFSPPVPNRKKVLQLFFGVLIKVVILFRKIVKMMEIVNRKILLKIAKLKKSI